MSDSSAHASADDLLIEINDGIALITFNRPQSRNALTFDMYERLAATCGRTDELAIKAIVITGAGDKAFAAGTDIAQFRAFRTADDALAYEARISAVLNAIEQCPVPTVAAINGACTGGGAGIAAACDIRLTSTTLRFGVPIARTLGNCMSSDTLSRLVSLVGAAATRELLLTARLVEADEAKSMGLVSEILPDRDAVLARAMELATTMAGHAPLTMRAVKEALRRTRQAQACEYPDLIEMCYTSEDFREGLTAFLEKRKPQWQGR